MNEKHGRFIDEYLIDRNAARAAIAAGYSEQSARSQGCRLLTNADIWQEIQRRQNQISTDLKITASNKRAALWDIVRFCGEPILGADGEVKMRNPRAARSAIAELNKMDGAYNSILQFFILDNQAASRSSNFLA